MSFANFQRFLDASEQSQVTRSPLEFPLRFRSHAPTRRAFLLTGVAAALAVPALKAAEPASETFRLERSGETPQLARVTVDVNVEGHLRVNPDGKEVKQLPLTAEGKLEYVERLLAAGAAPRSIRHYSAATASLKVNEATDNSELGESRRLVVVDCAEQRPLLYSPLGPFTREEIELLETPFNSLVIDQLLPPAAIRLEESWKHGDDVLCRLLGLDAVSKSEVRSTLREVVEEQGRKIARLELAGTLDGAVGGVATGIELKAKYAFDFSAGRITWLTAGIGEDRSIGHAAPGFRLVAKVRVVRQPMPAEHAGAAEVSTEAVRGIDLARHGGSELLLLDSKPGRFSLLHGRAWQMMADRPDVTILRLVERGDLIAQCNVSRLPPLEVGREVTLEEFQRDTQRALGQNFGQFIQASQGTTDTGLRMLRVLAAGKVSDIQIHWIYYHLSQGPNRVAVVFTIETKLTEGFAAGDLPLVSTLRFTRDASSTTAGPPKPPAKEEPAIKEESAAIEISEKPAPEDPSAR